MKTSFFNFKNKKFLIKETEVPIFGCFGYTPKKAHDFAKLFISKKSQIQLEKIITHLFSLSEIRQAYKTFIGKKSGKIVILMD